MYAYAQNDNLSNAYSCYQRASVDSAKMFIDRAIKEDINKNNAQAWCIRGFIYKDLYKKYETGKIRSASRDTAISDLFIAYRLDSVSQENKTNTYAGLDFLAATYENDAASNMDSIHFHEAIVAYNKHKSVMKRIKHTTNINTLDVQFYDALGEIYSLYFAGVNDFEQKRKYLDSARKAYDAVLAINPDDYSANYGLGRLYYNQAANIMTNLPFDAPLPLLNKTQDTCAHLAKLSLPYLDKAHKLEQLKIEPVKGLEGDYYLLHSTDNYLYYRNLEDKLRQQKNNKEDPEVLQAKYNEFITLGDNFLKIKDYEKAKDSYESALQIRPNEKYPKDQLQVIESIIGQNKK
jgi:tetratricopeptide (TPR) repeat protein